LFNQLGLNKREARELVDLFFEKSVPRCRAESSEASGFGNFDLRDKNQRPGAIPDGEEIPISARRVVTFPPGAKNSRHGSKLCFGPKNNAQLPRYPASATSPSER